MTCTCDNCGGLRDDLILFADALVSGVPGSLGSTAGRALFAASRDNASGLFDEINSEFDYAALSEFAAAQIPLIPEDADRLTRQQQRDIKRIIAPPVAEVSPRWGPTLAAASALAFMTGALQVDNFFTRSDRVSGVFSGPMPRRVIQLARRPAFTRARGMDATTLRLLNDTIKEAMLAGRTSGVGEVGRAVRRKFADMSRNRSRLIATTETNHAVSRGAWSKAAGLGSKTKTWLTVGDNRVDFVDCGANQSQGKISISEPFQSGHMTTGAHPRCRCAVSYFGADPAKVEVRFTRESRASWVASIPALIFVMAATVPGTKEGDPGHVREPRGLTANISN